MSVLILLQIAKVRGLIHRPLCLCQAWRQTLRKHSLFPSPKSAPLQQRICPGLLPSRVFFFQPVSSQFLCLSITISLLLSSLLTPHGHEIPLHKSTLKIFLYPLRGRLRITASSPARGVYNQSSSGRDMYQYAAP